jgi:hypothetical protein
MSGAAAVARGYAGVSFDMASGRLANGQGGRPVGGSDAVRGTVLAVSGLSPRDTKPRTAGGRALQPVGALFDNDCEGTRRRGARFGGQAAGLPRRRS